MLDSGDVFPGMTSTSLDGKELVPEDFESARDQKYPEYRQLRCKEIPLF